MLKIVAYYTEGTRYEQMAYVLKERMAQLGYELELTGYRNLGTWIGNVRYRPQHLLEVMDKYPQHNILSLDVDAQVRGSLDYFERLGHIDVGVYHHTFDNGSREVAPGTLYLTNNPKTRMLMSCWCEWCDSIMNCNSGVLLKRLLGGFVGDDPEGLKVFNLDVRYCNIEGIVSTDDWIIYHQQVHIEGGDLTLITPTGDRPGSFELCREMISRQSLIPYTWIVVDDGQVPLDESLLRGIEYIRRIPQSTDPKHTLGVNMSVAMQYVRTNRTAIIEDDDFYRSDYLETLYRMLDKQSLVGVGEALYYNIPLRKYKIHRNRRRASWCNTAFRKEVYNHVRRMAARHTIHLDIKVWKTWSGGTKVLMLDQANPITIGIKGVPGRAGMTNGWNPHRLPLEDDQQYSFLRKRLSSYWLGRYSQLFGIKIGDRLMTASTVNFKQLTIVTTTECSLNCPLCCNREVAKQSPGYHMRLDELDSLLRYLKDSTVRTVHSKLNIYLSGGDPTVWNNMEEGIKMLLESNIVASIVVCTNGLKWERLLKDDLIDRVILKVSEYSNVNEQRIQQLSDYMAGRYRTNREYRRRIHITKIRHDILPDQPHSGVLPADCCCPRPTYYQGMISPCYNVHHLSLRLGRQQPDAELICKLNEDYYDRFKDFGFDADICAACWSNQNLYDILYGRVPRIRKE